MARVNVFLKDELLDEINEEAKKEGTNRSALIQTALEKYIEGKRREREEQEKRKKMQDAFAQDGCFGKKVGEMGPSGNDPQISRR